MQNVEVVKNDGEKDLITVYNTLDFPYNKIDTKKQLIQRKTKQLKSYCQSFGTFDIETTTIIPDNDITPPWGFMYHWQFCVAGYVCIGRYWHEFIEFINRLQQFLQFDLQNRFVVYVHNLSYETQFMIDYLKQYFGDCNIFASAKRKPIKITVDNGLEFRCSYKLTNQNLYNATKNELGVTHIKAKDDLNYKLLRTPATKLTPVELGYCVSDVLSLYELIKCRLKNDKDNLETIPLTSTGYPRRDCRRACRQNPNYKRDIFDKQLMGEKVYTLLKEESRGGNTHANRRWSGKIADIEKHGNIHSFDFASSYPAQQLMKKFPMSKFQPYGEIESKAELNKMLNKYACLFRVSFDNLRIKSDNVTMPYIPTAKCWQLSKGDKGVFDNGRIISCKSASMTVCDIDFKIIEKQYTWDMIYISDFYYAKYDYLPEELRGQIKEYFNRKCILKEEIAELEKNGDYSSEIYKDKVYNYGKSKNLLNGIFGMSFTDPVHTEIILQDNGEWKEERPDIEKTLKKYNKSRNSFLVYAWGCWTTAHARAHLQRMIDITDKGFCINGVNDGTIYIDTDSSKCINPDMQAIKRMNDEIIELAEKRGAYCDVNGHRYYLGIAELETESEKKRIKQFITLGAKKYAYIDGNGLHCTVSGVNKEKGAKELENIKNFKIGYTFHVAGGSTLYYNDNVGIHDITVNGETFSSASNIGMIDSTYTVGITNEYAELIGIDLNVFDI